ncbi:hypothetical protein [Dactylosporangium sp. NPDC048998]|uniref:hypothetical protein n=1 Tax=Dactylosporangium sp. NPDC048998 TaxID=3363976 RepID=UPI003722755A
MPNEILRAWTPDKSNGGDLRESPARAVEPHALPRDIGALGGVTLVDLTAVEVMAADAAVLLTDHDDFDYALVEEHAQYTSRHPRPLSRASCRTPLAARGPALR